MEASLLAGVREVDEDGRRLPAVNARSEVVPGPAPEPLEPTQLRLVFEGEVTELEPVAKPACRHAWAWLLRRVFAVDVMTCPKCQFPTGGGKTEAYLGLIAFTLLLRRLRGENVIAQPQPPPAVFFI